MRERFMLYFNAYKRRFFYWAALLTPAACLAIFVFCAQTCDAAALKNAGPFPLIIMGGRWSATYRPDYSDLSRVCGAGFTHVFSYYTEPGLGVDPGLDKAIDNAVEFAATVKKNCPGLGLVMGIPRRWIFDGRLDMIKAYVAGLNSRKVEVDYWLSDEMIHQMTREGLTLKDAERRATEAVNVVKQALSAPYIWVEPGNYNKQTDAILDVLSGLPAGIKSYDEYVISRTGRLSDSMAGFNGVLGTLKRLKSKGNSVFPVCEIGYSKKKKIAPTESEIAAISVSLMMEGADGLVFWEERWTTPEILQGIKRIEALMTFLRDVGLDNFVKTGGAYTAWEARSGKRVVRMALNTTPSNIGLAALMPKRSVVVWPPGGRTDELRPMELLVYYYE